MEIARNPSSDGMRFMLKPNGVAVVESWVVRRRLRQDISQALEAGRDYIRDSLVKLTPDRGVAIQDRLGRTLFSNHGFLLRSV